MPEANPPPKFGEYLEAAAKDLMLARASLQSARGVANPAIEPSLKNLQDAIKGIEDCLPNIVQLDTGLRAIS